MKSHKTSFVRTMPMFIAINICQKSQPVASDLSTTLCIYISQHLSGDDFWFEYLSAPTPTSLLLDSYFSSLKSKLRGKLTDIYS